MESGGSPPQDPGDQPVRDGYWIAFALCAVLYTLPLFTFRYLPMVDLPQRVAQVWLWCHLDDPMLGGRYELHLFSPYVLSYAVARCFAFVLDPKTAVTVVIALTILGTPLAMHALLRAFGSVRWWSLLGFPLAYGVSFYWGFVPYSAAIPFGVLMMAYARECTETPSASKRARLAAAGFAAFFTHGLVWAFSAGVCCILFLSYRTTLKTFLANTLTAAAAAPFAFAWFFDTQRASEQVHEAIEWNLGLPRFKLLVSEWIGIDAADWAFAFGLLLLGLIATGFLLSEPSRRSWKRWLPCGIACACYLLLPAEVFHTFVFFERFAVFVPVLAVAAIPAPTAATTRRRVQLAVLTAVLLYSAVLWPRLTAFDREARSYTALYEHMRPGKRLHAFAYESRSAVLGGPYYFHFPVWYQSEVGGEAFFSFALMFAEPVRCKTVEQMPIPDDRLGLPSPFDPAQANAYDYFVIRSHRDLAPIVFAKIGSAVRLVSHVDDWWLYERAAHLEPEGAIKDAVLP